MIAIRLYHTVKPKDNTSNLLHTQNQSHTAKMKVNKKKKKKKYLIFPNVEKIVCVTNIDGFDETLGSANHLEGTPLITIVSGSSLPLE